MKCLEFEGNFKRNLIFLVSKLPHLNLFIRFFGFKCLCNILYSY